MLVPYEPSIRHQRAAAPSPHPENLAEEDTVEVRFLKGRDLDMAEPRDRELVNQGVDYTFGEKIARFSRRAWEAAGSLALLRGETRPSASAQAEAVAPPARARLVEVESEDGESQEGGVRLDAMVDGEQHAGQDGGVRLDAEMPIRMDGASRPGPTNEAFADAMNDIENTVQEHARQSGGVEFITEHEFSMENVFTESESEPSSHEASPEAQTEDAATTDASPHATGSVANARMTREEWQERYGQYQEYRRSVSESVATSRSEAGGGAGGDAEEDLTFEEWWEQRSDAGEEDQQEQAQRQDGKRVMGFDEWWEQRDIGTP
ncbi:hypothetical protein SLS60_002748 [Paraconiothyrium brasiliense]|uniref:Uncharacterized protein n=1 Tax=Paraconiothyrium brasiliense TaxID=300254 RepID=A0ABR3RTQ1_9PLEO